MSIDRPEMAPLQQAAAVFRCPACQGQLAPHSADCQLLCTGCHAAWPVYDGIPCFIPSSELPDYQLSADMAALVQRAHESGWQTALEDHLAQSGKRRSYAQEYVSSEARADFRFLMSLGLAPVVLDVGSGWGNISVAFARNAGRVYSLDTTLANLQFVGERAQQEGLDNVIPVLGDAAHLPLPPASCDAVLMVGVLEWVAWGREAPEPKQLQQQALREAYRVLRPGGQLYIAIENRYSIKSFLGFREPHTGLRFMSLLPRWLADRYSRRARGRPFREYTHSAAALVRLLQQAGFATVERYYPLPNYQNFRYITGFSDQRIVRFLVSRLQGHGRFAGLFAAAIRAGVELRLHTAFAPCFAFLAARDQ